MSKKINANRVEEVLRRSEKRKSISYYAVLKNYVAVKCNAPNTLPCAQKIACKVEKRTLPTGFKKDSFVYIPSKN